LVFAKISWDRVDRPRLRITRACRTPCPSRTVKKSIYIDANSKVGGELESIYYAQRRNKTIYNDAVSTTCTSWSRGSFFLPPKSNIHYVFVFNWQD
jgi:hypothetical protein